MDSTLLLHPGVIKHVKHSSLALPKQAKQYTGLQCTACMLPLFALLFIVMYVYLSSTSNEWSSTIVNVIAINTKWREEPRFHPFENIHVNIDCGLLFKTSEIASNYAQKVRKTRFRITKNIVPDTSCSAIRSRGFYPTEPLTKEEASFPLAIARIVHEDYLLLETLFSMDYAPQNSYCYIVDKKAASKFKQSVRNFQSCFSNVIVPDVELDVQSVGKNMTLAHLICLKYLSSRPWQYVTLLQNNDVPMKTNAEKVAILSSFDGANDISTAVPANHVYDSNLNWTFAHLHLFKDEQLNNNSKRLWITKSLVQVTISRAAVDYVLKNINPKKLIDQIETKSFGMDELFWGTLNGNNNIPVPGRFTRQCLNERKDNNMISRFTRWLGEESFPCSSGKFRRWICIFGVEDLTTLNTRPELYANKFMPSFDYGALMCMAENIFNRTYGLPAASIKLNMSYYQNLPHVRYQKYAALQNKSKKFEC